MAFAVSVLTQNNLNGFTDQQIANALALIPTSDRCAHSDISKPLTRTHVERYIADAQSEGLGALKVLEDGNPYGLILYQRSGSVVTVRRWVVRIANMLDVAAAVVAFASGAGITVIHGVVSNKRVRDRMAEYPGVTVTGNFVEYVL